MRTSAVGRTNGTGRRAPIALLSAPATMRGAVTVPAAATDAVDERAPQASAPLAASRPVQAAFALPPDGDEPPAAVPSTRSMPFLAHLVATRLRLPQTRARRRASLPEALACYEAAAALSAE